MPAEADSVSLDGQSLLVEGPVAGKSVSEFTSGLKIGRATQDDRQHAFYNDFDDFSGGFGRHQLDIREALGTHWDNAGGVDLRRRQHITLPPKRYVLEADVEPAAMILSSEILAMGAVGVPRDDPGAGIEDYFYFGAGDTVYRMGTNRETLVAVARFVASGATGIEVNVDGAKPQYIQRMFLHRGTDLVRRLYVVTADPAAVGPTSNFMFCENPGAASPTFQNGSRFLWDAISVPTGMGGASAVIAQETTFRIMESYTPTTALTDWNIDDTSPTKQGPLWIPSGIVRFIGAGLAPWGGSAPAIYFVDLGDGNLYALSAGGQFAERIDLGDFHYLLNGTMWQGFVAITDGFDVWLYSPGGGGQETVRQIRLYSKDGIPPSVRAGRYRITGLVDGGAFLYAIAEFVGTDGKATSLGYIIFVYNGAGWSTYYPEVSALQNDATVAVNPMGALVDRHPVGIHVASNIQTTTSRTLALLCQADPSTGLKAEVHSIRLPEVGQIPIDGVDEFECDITNGQPFLTGWLNGGFAGLSGALFHMIADLMTGEATTSVAGVSVKIDYRLNDDETAAWTNLGTAIVTGRTVLEFDSASKAGVEFRTVQFRVTFQRTGPLLDGAISGTGTGTFNVDSTTGWPSEGEVSVGDGTGEEIMHYSSITSTSFTVSAAGDRGFRGSTALTHLDNAQVVCLNRTAELRGLTLVYAKKPPFRQTWLFVIDIDKMVEQGITGTGWTGTATHQKVWDFLKTTWNKQTLVKLIVNEHEPTANNLRVEIADINEIADDIRHTPTTKGRATVTVIEPVRIPT